MGVGGTAATFAFMFTDLEGSTRRWDVEPDTMRRALSQHDSIVRGQVDTYGGSIFATARDGFAAVFSTAGQAVRAAVDIQREIARTTWPTRDPLVVRVGLHVGEADRRDDNYFGPALNRCARLMACAYGGQIVCTQTVAALVAEDLGDASLLSLGEHVLPDLSRSEHVYQVCHPELRHEFGLGPTTLDASGRFLLYGTAESLPPGAVVSDSNPLPPTQEWLLADGTSTSFPQADAYLGIDW